jgi:hypothetical protein
MESGRPRLQAHGARRVNVTLRDEDIELFRVLGNGNVSAGTRQAAGFVRLVVEHAGAVLDALYVFERTAERPTDLRRIYDGIKGLQHDLEAISGDAGKSRVESTPLEAEREKAFA